MLTLWYLSLNSVFFPLPSGWFLAEAWRQVLCSSEMLRSDGVNPLLQICPALHRQISSFPAAQTQSPTLWCCPPQPQALAGKKGKSHFSLLAHFPWLHVCTALLPPTLWGSTTVPLTGEQRQPSSIKVRCALGFLTQHKQTLNVTLSLKKKIVTRSNREGRKT